MHNLATPHAGALKKTIVTLAVLAVTLILAAIFAGPPLAASIIKTSGTRAASNAIGGSITVENIALSWLGSQRAEGLTLLDADGNTVANIGSARIDRSLLALIADPANIGTVTLENTSANLAVARDGSTNLQSATTPTQPDGETPRDNLPPSIPTNLNIHPVLASPAIINYTTPNANGVLSLNLTTDPITASNPTNITLTATQNPAPAANSPTQSLTATLAIQRLAGQDDRIDLNSAQPTLEIRSENAPNGLVTLANALAGTAAPTPPPATARPQPLSIDAAFTLRDGSLQLKEPTQPARIGIPIARPLLALIESQRGNALNIDTPGTATLTIDNLNIPTQRLIAKAAGWPTPPTAPGLGNATINAALAIPKIAGTITPPIDNTQPETFTAQPATFIINAHPLATALRITGNLTIEPERTAPTTLATDLAITGLTSRPDRVLALDNLAIDGSLNAERIPTAIIDPLVSTLDLNPLLGDNASLTFTASIAQPNKPAALTLRINTTHGHLLTMSALLDDGTITAREDGLTLKDPTPARTIDTILAALKRPERLNGTTDQPLIINIPRLSIPIDAAQPLTQTTATIAIDAPRITTAAGSTIAFAAEAQINNNSINVRGTRDTDHTLATITSVDALLTTLGLPPREFAHAQSSRPIVISTDGSLDVHLANLSVATGNSLTIDQLKAHATIGAIAITNATEHTRIVRPNLCLDGHKDDTFSFILRTEPDSTLALDVSGTYRAAFPQRRALTALLPTSVEGNADNIPTWLANAFVNDRNAHLFNELALEPFDLVFSTDEGSGTPTFNLTASSPTTTIAAHASAERDTIRISDTRMTTTVSPEIVRRVINTTTGRSLYPLSLRSPSTLNATISDLTISLADMQPSLVGNDPIRITMTADDAISINVARIGTAPSTLNLSELQSILLLPVDSTPLLNVSFDLGSESGSRLAHASLEAHLVTPVPRFVAELRDADSLGFDKWLANEPNEHGRPLSSALGPEFNATIASTIGNESSERTDDALVLMLASEKLNTSAIFKPSRNAEKIVGFYLDQPAQITTTATPELVSMLVTGSKKLPVTLDRPTPLQLTLASCELGPMHDLFDPSIFAISATLDANRVALRPAQIEPKDADILEWSAFTVSLDRDPTSSERTDPPLTINASANNLDGQRTLQVRAAISDLSYQPTIDATVNASLPASILDAVAETNALLAGVFGDNLSVQIYMQELAPDASSGAITTDIEAPNAYAHFAGHIRDRNIEIDPGTSPSPSALTIERIPENMNRAVLNRILPLVATIEKTPQDDPLVIEFGAPRPLTLPLDGNVSSLNGSVTVDIGTGSIRASQMFKPILKRTAVDHRSAVGDRFQPFVIAFDQGVANYDNVRIPLGEFTVETTASVDLPAGTMAVSVLLPAAALAEEAGAKLPDALPVRNIPLKFRGPIDGERRLRIDTDSLVEENARDFVNDLVDKVRSGSGHNNKRQRPIDDLLDNIFNR